MPLLSVLKCRIQKPLDKETIDLIIDLKRLNPKWGAQKISHELAKIGYQASKRTVLKYLEIYGLNVPTPTKIMTWSEFLHNHKFKIGVDFTSLISFMGHQLFIFVIIDLDSRKILCINVTYTPNSAWVIQQFKNTFYDLDQHPTLCICDRDQIFSGWFGQMMDDYFQIKIRQNPIKSPWKNGIVERFHLSLKNEVFDTIAPVTLNQVIRVCREYQRYFNYHQPHQGIGGAIPSIHDHQWPKNKFFFKKVGHLAGKITALRELMLSGTNVFSRFFNKLFTFESNTIHQGEIL